MTVKQALKHAAALIEALPYIKSFLGKVVVVKCGGSILDEAQHKRTIAQDIAFLRLTGMRPVVVHGGGSMITRRLAAHGRDSVFMHGRRVTSSEDMAHVEQALSAINEELVSFVDYEGVHAEGIHHQAHSAIRAGHVHEELGRVGQVHSIETKVFEAILEKKVPIVSPIGKDEKGITYNVNADEVACELAVALGAEKLIILTDVLGVMKDPEDPKTLMSTLTSKEAQELIEKSVIQSGMLPKVEAGLTALSNGVAKVHLISARLEHALLAEVFTDKGIGTQLLL